MSHNLYRSMRCFLVLAAFLFAQAIAVIHVSEHGVLDHNHNGVVCKICVSAHASFLDTANVAVYHERFATYLSYSFSHIEALYTQVAVRLSARAPPYHA